MKRLNVALVTMLFLLIPHQAPFAGPAADGDATAGDRGQTTVAASGAESTAKRVETAFRTAPQFDEGFVWSLATSTDRSDSWSANPGYLETDGYSWSARSAVDATPTP